MSKESLVSGGDVYAFMASNEVRVSVLEFEQFRQKFELELQSKIPPDVDASHYKAQYFLKSGRTLEHDVISAEKTKEDLNLLERAFKKGKVGIVNYLIDQFKSSYEHNLVIPPALPIDKLLSAEDIKNDKGLNKWIHKANDKFNLKRFDAMEEMDKINRFRARVVAKKSYNQDDGAKTPTALTANEELRYKLRALRQIMQQKKGSKWRIELEGKKYKSGLETIPENAEISLPIPPPNAARKKPKAKGR